MIAVANPPRNEYGSVQHYREIFADHLADVATGDKEADAETIANILEGFECAIIDWMQYHEEALARFHDLHGKFMRGEFAIERARREASEEPSY